MPNLSNTTRRGVLAGGAAGLTASVLAYNTPIAIAEPPPEVDTIRLLIDPAIPILCYAPQYIAMEFLRLEGFQNVETVPYGDYPSDAATVAAGAAHFSAVLASDWIVSIDQGMPVTVLGGIHAGCVELFANERVKSIRDLAGKRILANAEYGPEYVFISSVAAYVGIDPQKDIDWVFEPDYTKWDEMLKSGEVDVVNAFPPQNYPLHDDPALHVILNTTLDDPWRNFFCCMFGGNTEFVKSYPIATKRAMRALAKANQVCALEPDRAAQLLVEYGATDRLEFAHRLLAEVPYSSWRVYDPTATLRFFALRLREGGLIRKSPNAILSEGTDFAMFEELKRELKS